MKITAVQYNWFINQHGMEQYDTVKVGYVDRRGVETTDITERGNGYQVNFSDGTTGTSRSIGGTRFHNFDDGTSVTCQTIGSMTFCN